MFEKHDDPDRSEADEAEGFDEHPDRIAMLPPMPTWMAEGQEPPESAIVRRRRPVRSVVFEFESIASRPTPRRVA